MPEYIERDLLLEDINAAQECGGMGYVTAQTLRQYVKRLSAADVVSAEEFALLEAKNEVLGQENDRLKAEIKRLHGENFWLTGGLGHEKG